MEDILEVYRRPFDPKRPLVCLDEALKQLLSDGRDPLGIKPGRAQREDYEYVRGGTAALFMLFAPLLSWRHVEVSEQRRALDWAYVIRDLVDLDFPDAERIVLVMDNLNTHTPAALYEAFAPEEARRIAQKLEIHYTPKHGSWLNMAEIELSVLARQCLDRRIPDIDILAEETLAWEEARNQAQVSVHWRFTTEDARIKLHKLYPSIQA
jgi:DDE superfamily endonuclease